MYGETITIGVIRVWIYCCPKDSDEKKMKQAKRVLMQWVENDCPYDESITTTL